MWFAKERKGSTTRLKGHQLQLSLKLQNVGKKRWRSPSFSSWRSPPFSPISSVGEMKMKMKVKSEFKKKVVFPPRVSEAQ